MRLIYSAILLIASCLFSTGIVISLGGYNDAAEFLFEKLGYDTTVLKDPSPSLFRLAVMGSSLENDTVLVVAKGRGRAFNRKVFVDLGGGEFDLTSFVNGLTSTSKRYVFLMCLEGKGEKNEAYAMRFTLGNTYPPKNVSFLVFWGEGSSKVVLGALFGYADADNDGQITLKEIVDYSKENVNFVKWRGNVDIEIESLFSRIVEKLVEIHGEIPEKTYRELVKNSYSFPDCDLSPIERLLNGDFKNSAEATEGFNLDISTFRFDGGGNDRLYSIVETKDGYLAVGYTNSSCSRGSNDVWVMKISKDFKVLWSECYGGEGDDRGYSVSKVDGGYLILGRTSSKGGNVSGWHRGYEKGHPTYDAWIFKMDEDGNIEWSVVLGGSGNDLAFSSLELEDGYLVSGWTSSHDGDFPYILGESDFFVVKLSRNGKVIWKKTFGTKGTEGEGRLSPVLLNLGKNFAIVGRGDGESYMFEFDEAGFPLGRRIFEDLEITDASTLNGEIHFVAEAGNGSVFGKIESGRIVHLADLRDGDKLRLKGLEIRKEKIIVVGWILRGSNVDAFLGVLDEDGTVLSKKVLGREGTDVLISVENGIGIGWSYSGKNSDGLVVKIGW